MDLGLSRDMFDSFVKFQRMLHLEYRKMRQEFGFEVINANQRVETIQRDLRRKIGALLGVTASMSDSGEILLTDIRRS